MFEGLLGILTAAIRAGAPILFATQGEIITERSGVLNLGLEGMMLMGAMYGFIFSWITGSPWLGLVAACIAGALLSLLHALLTVGFGVNQVVSGIALNFIGTGFTSVVGNQYVGQSATGFATWELPLLCNIPVLGDVFFKQNALVYLSYVLVPVILILLYRTRVGLNIRAVGDAPVAADAAGLHVNRIRLGCVALGGALCGLGGAYMSLAYTTLWQPQMTSGKGWIAVALVIFAQWKPLRATFGAYLFGGVTALQLAIQVQGTTISSHFLQMMPYVFTILALTFAMWRVKRKGASSETTVGPASLGNPYLRGR